MRPIYHHRDDTTGGHIVACFVALCLEVDLQRRLDAAGVESSWPELMRDLHEVEAVDVTLDGQRYRLRTDMRGNASAVFAAAGVRPPRVVERIAEPRAVRWRRAWHVCETMVGEDSVLRNDRFLHACTLLPNGESRSANRVTASHWRCS